jgi:D-alanyl-D-alanine dipeptidase
MTTLANTLAHLAAHPDFVNLRDLPSVRIDLKYNTTDNFMGKDVYAEFTEPFLHRLAAEKLRKATKILLSEKPGWSFLILDVLRPRSVQRLLWAHVVGTPQQGYVANPERGSVHNYGCAVDLTVLDEKGRELDMGTAFDTFHPLSQPKLEAENLQSGALTAIQVENRFILRRAMTGGGFLQLPHEWWHYDAFPGDEVRSRFELIE